MEWIDIFCIDDEEFLKLQCKYNLEDCGMSGRFIGWHWFHEDEAKVNVYMN